MAVGGQLPDPWIADPRNLGWGGIRMCYEQWIWHVPMSRWEWMQRYWMLWASVAKSVCSICPFNLLRWAIKSWRQVDFKYHCPQTKQELSLWNPLAIVMAVRTASCFLLLVRTVTSGGRSVFSFGSSWIKTVGETSSIMAKGQLYRTAVLAIYPRWRCSWLGDVAKFSTVPIELGGLCPVPESWPTIKIMCKR